MPPTAAAWRCPGVAVHFSLQSPLPGVTLSPDSSTTGKSDHADCGSSRVMFPAKRYGVAGDGAVPHAHHMTTQKALGSWKTAWETARTDAGGRAAFTTSGILR